MLHRFLSIPKISLAKHQVTWLLAAIVALEYLTPPEYVFGYLYTGPILIANARLSRAAGWRVTILGAGLTLFNLIIPGKIGYSFPAFANRLIAVLALLVTGWLSDRNRFYQEAIARQEAQLRTQEKLASIREDFVSTLTHDLKTPLLGAIETINSFQSGLFGEVTPTQKKVLEMMRRSHNSTLQLVQTVLDIYRNDTEGLQLHTQPVNLAEIAQETSATLTNLATSRRVSLSINYGESEFARALWVNGDALQLQRVFSNLLINGINHSPRGGRVEVVLESVNSYHQVLVKDRGSGIVAEELPHLFERFYQGNSDRQATGSGLGLYLTRQIIDAHGGTIWAKNRQPQGAIFGFRLPVYLTAPLPPLR
ncbi:sensor histidine kinase [Oscillatoria salina]|uniref:sensor histidine kinase n=1 Tax=Oscillatoria salina TaxID=331517 RepID=UPI0013B68A06|nr:HAMP domain-containing sensor histidine kinase [Oscillatoria salina]MBZ8182422.1 HAMP domain-containing histidine kinase [Oscillatoria salina IIICB1]NET90916.1 HAMP domain-containing histidine kinase [Kamptonema sp. SIO1D9]